MMFTFIVLAYGSMLILSVTVAAVQAATKEPSQQLRKQQSLSTSEIIARNEAQIERDELILSDQFCYRCQGHCRCGMWTKIFHNP